MAKLTSSLMKHFLFSLGMPRPGSVIPLPQLLWKKAGEVFYPWTCASSLLPFHMKTSCLPDRPLGQDYWRLQDSSLILLLTNSESTRSFLNYWPSSDFSTFQISWWEVYDDFIDREYVARSHVGFNEAFFHWSWDYKVGATRQIYIYRSPFTHILDPYIFLKALRMFLDISFVNSVYFYVISYFRISVPDWKVVLIFS